MDLRLHEAKRAERIEKRSTIATIMFGLLFVGWVWEPTLEQDPNMYLGLWRSPLVLLAPMFAPIPGLSLTPWQILLFAFAPFCLGNSDGKRRHAREMDWAILVSVVCIAVTFLWGLVRGGSPYFAYYQLWRLLAALLIAYMLMSVLRSERDLVTLGKLIILVALIRATVCVYFYWAYVYGKIYPLPEFLTNHEDTLIFVAGILVASIWAGLKGGKAWTIAILVVPYLLYAVVLNNRRLAWVELGLAMPLIYFLLGPGPARSRINRWVMWVAPLALIYLVAGLGSDSPVFAPVHALMTTGSNNDPSSLTRQEEVRNLLHTLVDRGNPVLGTGWGLPYDKAESYWSNYDARWILTLYTPHNSLIGVAVYSGLLGMIGIWGVVPIGAYLAARGSRGSTDLVLRAAGMVALGSLAAYSVHCYGDLGLQSFQGALLFGAALATAGKVAVWSDEALRSASTMRFPTTGGCTAPDLSTGGKAGARLRRSEPSSQTPGPSARHDQLTKPARAPTRRPSR